MLNCSRCRQSHDSDSDYDSDLRGTHTLAPFIIQFGKWRDERRWEINDLFDSVNWISLFRVKRDLWHSGSLSRETRDLSWGEKYFIWMRRNNISYCLEWFLTLSLRSWLDHSKWHAFSNCVVWLSLVRECWVPVDSSPSSSLPRVEWSRNVSTVFGSLHIQTCLYKSEMSQNVLVIMCMLQQVEVSFLYQSHNYEQILAL